MYWCYRIIYMTSGHILNVFCTCKVVVTVISMYICAAGFYVMRIFSSNYFRAQRRSLSNWEKSIGVFPGFVCSVGVTKVYKPYDKSAVIYVLLYVIKIVVALFSCGSRLWCKQKYMGCKPVCERLQLVLWAYKQNGSIYFGGSDREQPRIGKHGGRSQLRNWTTCGDLRCSGLWTGSVRTWYNRFWSWCAGLGSQHSPRAWLLTSKCLGLSASVFWLRKPVPRAVLTAKPSTPWSKHKTSHSAIGVTTLLFPRFGSSVICWLITVSAIEKSLLSSISSSVVLLSL